MLYTDRPVDFNPSLEAVGCLLFSNGLLLMLQGKMGKAYTEGKWGSPAGKVNHAEDKDAAMIREVQEEVGITLAANDIQFLQTVYVRYPGRDFIYHIYTAVVPPNTPVKLSAEHTDFRWERLEAALQYDLIPDEDSVISLFLKTPRYREIIAKAC